ncbi:MAG: putative Ig domain-containing protein, partial [Oscillospiraceae bacterium]|nr:putative Ig domain-containing protein [Oscillospiraceae bacterium]
MKRRLLATLLTIAMVLSLFSTSVVTVGATTNDGTNKNFRCGDVDGNDTIGISDVLEILKYLAKMTSTVTGDPKSFKAGRVMENRVEGQAPAIGDVLEILKYLAKMNSVFGNPSANWAGGLNAPGHCYCDWCGTETKDPPTNITSNLPGGTVDEAYNGSFSAGGKQPISWAVSGGALPGGLTLNSNGTVTGTPTTEGTFSFTVTATNDDGSLTSGWASITIGPKSDNGIPPSNITSNLSDGTVGEAYPGGSFSAVGSTPMTWALHSGALPGGLTLNSNGTISGTPNAAGTFSFQVRATNAYGEAISSTVSITINPAVTQATTTTTQATTTTTQASNPGTDPTDPTNPTNPTDPTDPTNPTSPTDPTTTTSETTTSATTTTSETTTSASTTTSMTTTSTSQSEGEVPRPQFLDVQGNNFAAGFINGDTFVQVVPHPSSPTNTIVYITVSSARANENGTVISSSDPYRMNTNTGLSNFGHARLQRHDGGISPLRVDNRGLQLEPRQLDSRAVPVVPQTSGGQSMGTTSGHTSTIPAEYHHLTTINPNSLRAVRIRPGVDAFTISAVAYDPDTGRYSDVRTRTWITARENNAPSWADGQNQTGSSTGARTYFHQDMLIVSLYSDAEHIFSRETGIFNDGVDRDEWNTRFIAINSAAGNNGVTAAAISEAKNSHLSQGIFPPTLPANFTRRGRIAAERPAHLEIFNPQGERLVSQRVGIRVKGGWSRGTFINEQKTFEIYCRNGYGDASYVNYPLFGMNYHDEYEGNLMQRFERFRVRMGGNDREQTYMRDELAQDLARLSGMTVPQMHRPSVTYLNGAYYGLTWMRSPRTENHWERLYGGRENGYEILGANERGRAFCGRQSCGRAMPSGSNSRTPTINGVTGTLQQLMDKPAPALCGDVVSGQSTPLKCGRSDCENYWQSFNEGCTETSCKARSAWQAVEAAATGGDRDNPTANVSALEALVDLDQMMQYYALNTWGANVDWPSNNVEMWRYFPRHGTASPSVRCTNPQTCTVADCESNDPTLHPYLRDGKWRMVVADFEFGLGLWQNGAPDNNATHESANTIHALIHRTGGGTPLPGHDPYQVPTMTGDTQAGQGRIHFNATRGNTFIIAGLMKDEAMRAKYANAMFDLIEHSHTSAMANTVYGYLAWTIREEHIRMLGGQARGGSGARDQWDWDGALARTNSDYIRISELPRGGGATGDAANFPFFIAIFDGSDLDGGHLHLRNFLNN